jgi:hypothetical protein
MTDNSTECNYTDPIRVSGSRSFSSKEPRRVVDVGSGRVGQAAERPGSRGIDGRERRATSGRSEVTAD